VIDALHEVVVTPRRAFPQLPDLRVIERAGWLQIITPSIKSGGMNEVIHSALAEDDADRIIDETIAMYRDLGLRFRWNAGPGSAPADLGERLARRARDRLGPRDGMPDHARARARRLRRRARRRRSDRRLHARDGDRLDRGPCSARCAAPPPARRGRSAHVRRIANREPVGAASYHAFERSAFLRGGVVLSAARGRGVYRALVAARLAHARSLGIPLATTHAREATSAPILEHLGFETVFRFAMYFG